jgi:hypothetical protein
LFVPFSAASFFCSSLVDSFTAFVYCFFASTLVLFTSLKVVAKTDDPAAGSAPGVPGAPAGIAAICCCVASAFFFSSSIVFLRSSINLGTSPEIFDNHVLASFILTKISSSSFLLASLKSVLAN